MFRLMLCYIAICDPSLAIVQQCNIIDSESYQIVFDDGNIYFNSTSVKQRQMDREHFKITRNTHQSIT